MLLFHCCYCVVVVSPVCIVARATGGFRALDVDVDDPYAGRASLVAIAKAVGVTTPLVHYEHVRLATPLRHKREQAVMQSSLCYFIRVWEKDLPRLSNYSII